jgi:hypothetical protein
VNLFLIGWSPSGEADAGAAEAALRALLDQLPFFEGERVESWRAPSGRLALAWVAHSPERVGGVRYVDADAEGMALFSGRPFRWTGEFEADGRMPLTPDFYRRPALEWAEELDGRWVAARYADGEGTLELAGDALGAYPLFSGRLDGTRWISNNAALVRTALGAGELDLDVIACLLASGWSLSGEPFWSQVRRLPRGAVVRLEPGRPDAVTELMPLEWIAPLSGGGFDPRRAARVLVAATAALADWPGRPAILQLSGGRDSRLLLAAALRGGVETEVVTHGAPDSPDVQVAARLCAEAGIPHERRSPDPGGALHDETVETARILGLSMPGAISLEDSGGYFTPAAGVLPLLFNGQGGEIARAFYGNGNGDGVVERLSRAVVDSGELLVESGRTLVERELATAVDEALAAGFAPGDVPDAFYLRRRMGAWAAAGHGCVEYAKGDSICPLWSRRLLAEQLGVPGDQRAAERFPEATAAALSPRLARVPYAGGGSASTSKAYATAHAAVREAAAASSSHPAWEVLDQSVVRDLLASDPASLDTARRRAVWRAGTVLMSAGAA